MKKKKIFSRIFAAALAAAIAATTLITNSGTGLLAFAEGEETYSVKIISPDVPADGKTYTYNFYQIIAGEVEDDGGKNVLTNPEWGEALGSDFTTRNYFGENGHYITAEEALFLALSQRFSYSGTYVDYNRGPSNTHMYENIGVMFTDIYITYGGSSASNPFKDKFVGSASGSNLKTRDAAGLVEVLSPDNTVVSKDNAALKALAELLINGKKVDTFSNGTADIKFITGSPAASINVTSSNTTPYEETGLKSGYYLVTCVDSNNKLTNADYNSTTGDNKVQNKTNSPIKPVSTMLILVGPANDGVAEIVGKNAYTVPTVTLEMYKDPVELSKYILTDNDNKDIVNTTLNPDPGYDNDIVGFADTIAKASEDDWSTTGSFDSYEVGYGKDRQEAILYRIGITLPLNFDQYANSGYFLAVLNQYCHYGTTTDGDICRVTNCRPYVYHKSKDGVLTEIGRYMGNTYDNQREEGEIVLGSYSSSLENTLSKSANKVYQENAALGFQASNYGLFCLGDLYTHTDKTETVEGKTITTREHKAEYTLGDGSTVSFKGGDTIYIYYPAVLKKSRIDGNYSDRFLVNTNRVWAVYSNNPYADELDYVDANTKVGYTHVKDNQVGVSPIAEANVNTYGVTLKVDGENGYTNGAKYALYKKVEIKEGDKNKTENYYALIYVYSNAGYVKKWIPESEFTKDIAGYNNLNEQEKKEALVKELLKNSFGSTTDYTYLSGYEGISSSGYQIKGLAAGEYFLQELTISSGSVTGNPISWNNHVDNPNHNNIIEKHYDCATKPIAFKIEDVYNEDRVGYYGAGDNVNTILKKLTVDFKRDDKDAKIIKTYVYMWDSTNTAAKDENQHSATLNIDNADTTKSTFATKTGEFTIEVFHITNNTIWLPETGGIGTAIFFIVGGTIVVAATVLIVTRFRVKRERL